MLSLREKDNSLIELSEELVSVKNSLLNETKNAERLAELLMNKDLKDDQLFIGKYNKSKSNISTYKSRIESIEQRIKERANNDRIKAYKDEIGEVDLTSFTQLKQAINNILEYIEISSFKSVHGWDLYVIEIKYRGFNELTRFKTWQPYHDWIYDGGDYLKPNKNDLEYPTKVVERQTKSYLQTIFIDKGDLIVFN